MENIMNTFSNAVKNQKTTTTNGMVALKSTGNASVSLFYKIGASRGKNIIPDFVAALAENQNHALRIAAWSRDVRGGAGERQIFRDILTYLETNDTDAAKALARKVPELGRWDDLLVFKGAELKHFAFDLIKEALDAGNGLAAKWMPRKGEVAVELRDAFGWTPKFYRKRLVELTNVVETQMCAKDWDNINFNHVPSLASSRYKMAFYKHTAKYAEWTAALASGDPNVKVNASAVYPYDVLKGLAAPSHYGTTKMTKAELDHITAQWEALPNYVGEANILPLVDVSGSMTSKAGGHQSKSTVTCLDVSVSLGLYLADKNKGKFKDTFLTFSTNPELLHLKGNIVQKIDQMIRSSWAMSTNLEAAFDLILRTAINGNVPPEEMPSAVLILSDMQFNRCVSNSDHTAMKMIEQKFRNAGYEAPQVVFWNLNAYENVPVSHDKSGAALVSGFSPAILKSVLATDFDRFSPENVMLETIMNPRYDI
jgi:hypothetical protein